MLKKAGILVVLAMLTTTAIGYAESNNSACVARQSSKQEVKKVLKFDEEIVRKLMLEDGIPGSRVNSDIRVLKEMDAKLQPVLDAYITDRTISESFNIEGLTTKMIKEYFRCNFWEALERMDISLDNPSGAKTIYEAIKSGDVYYLPHDLS